MSVVVFPIETYPKNKNQCHILLKPLLFHIRYVVAVDKRTDLAQAQSKKIGNTELLMFYRLQNVLH